MTATYNIAVIGKTGVGKSAFVNYLYGKNVAEVGVGKPVTSKGFHSYEMKIKELPVTLFDSWGLEVGKEKEWMNDLENELNKRGVDKPASEWFHSVFYCINSGGARIEDCDKEIIKKFMDHKYAVSVILTKADQISEEDESKLKTVLQKMFSEIDVIAVCSEDKTTRSGPTKPFGKGDVELKAYRDFFQSLINRLPLHCEEELMELKKQWRCKVDKEIDTLGLFNYSLDKNKHIIKTYTDELILLGNNKVILITNNAIQMYAGFIKNLDYPPISIAEFNQEYKSLLKNSPSLIDKWYDYVGIAVLGIPVAVFTTIREALSAKGNDKMQLNEISNRIEGEIENWIASVVKDIRNKLIQIRGRAPLALPEPPKNGVGEK